MKTLEKFPELNTLERKTELHATENYSWRDFRTPKIKWKKVRGASTETKQAACLHQLRISPLTVCTSALPSQVRRSPWIQNHVDWLNISTLRTLLVVEGLGLCAPNAVGQGSIPGQGTKSHVLELRGCMLQLKDPACCNQDPAQTNKYFF